MSAFFRSLHAQTDVQIITFRNCMLTFFEGPSLHLRIHQSDSTTVVTKLCRRAELVRRLSQDAIKFIAKDRFAKYF